MDVPGADLLMNTSAMAAANTKLPEMESVNLDFTDLPSEPAAPPRLVPSAEDVGATKTWDGVENLNAEAYLKPVNVAPKMSEDAIMKKKYEMLRKFERLNKLGVPIRKRFTMDSPLDEMEMELEFVRKEKAMDSTIKQFSEWFITGMSAMEWGSKNVGMLKMFGLQLDGLSQSAQMNVGDLEEDFEELYDLYGDQMRMHPLVRIPMRTCFMVYMVHLTNQMAMKAPVPNIQEILRQNPDIARQMAAQAMQGQTEQFRQQSQRATVPTFPSSAQGSGFSAPAPPPAQMPASNFDNPLAGLMSFLGGVNTPPPQQQAPPAPTRTIPLKAPSREMKMPSATGLGIGDILNKINKEEKKVVAGNSAPLPPTQAATAPMTFASGPPPPQPARKSVLKRSGGSERKSAKNSVVIKL
uniref:Uncharacterized protein n=1 Tax=viral metagenome TaxID=1070528 RepID=A0A6C0B6U3_9ZZZZ